MSQRIRGAVVALLALVTVAGLSTAARAAADEPSTAKPSAVPSASAPVAARPPLGWNDYYAFICDLNEKLIKQTADTIVNSGMRAAGYEYVNLDDCWSAKTRDKNGNLQADPVKFPHGIKALADYVHARGLKLGIYEDVGTKTCAGYPGSYGHVQQDANTFARWKIDFAKIDWCNVPFDQFPGKSQRDVAISLYTQYGQALKNTGRPMFYSVCEWDPKLKPWTWAAKTGGNMWRTSNDYGDTWRQTVGNMDAEAPLAHLAGPGHWNDPDILQVGLGGQTYDQYRAQFSGWAMLAAPLLAGNDLRSMTGTTRQILTNREVIAVDQDPLGKQATRIAHSKDADVWTRPLADGGRAVLLFNRSTQARTIATTAHAAGLPPASSYALRDLWRHRTTETQGRIGAYVPATSAVMYRVAPAHATYPPALEVSLHTTVPVAYRGSTQHVAEPGDTLPVRVSVRNDGTSVARSVRLTLRGPNAAWTIPGAVTRSALAPGQTMSGSWRVKVPTAERSGSPDLRATATFRSGGKSSSASALDAMTVRRVPSGTPYLTDLSWLSAENGYNHVQVNKTLNGDPIVIQGIRYAHGLWTNSIATITYYLGGNCSKFSTEIGLDDTAGSPATVRYAIRTDGRTVYRSGVFTNPTPGKRVNVDVTGARTLTLYVGDAGDGNGNDNADFGGPRLTCG